MNWIKSTFSDNQGVPSFKRQLSAILAVVFVIAIFTANEQAGTIAYLIGGVLGITGVEKFSTTNQTHENN